MAQPEQTKQYPKDTPENRAKKMREYKVFVFEEVMDLGSRGMYNKTKMENALNALGLEGWSLKKIVTKQIPGFASTTVQLIMILERDMPLEP